MKPDSPVFVVSATLWSTILLALGCGPSPMPSADITSLPRSNVDTRNTASHGRPVPLSLTFVVPAHVKTILKSKCFICHGGAELKGDFDLKQMVYRPKPESSWQPMDLAGVTRIKLAILPLDGNPPRMPKRAGSIWNPLTVEEANAIAKWTDYPFER